MLKYLLIVIVAVFAFQTPQALAQSSSIDTVLLRIDALILQMQLLKREVQALKSDSSVSGVVLGVGTTRILTQSLVFGETNQDIAKIQKLLSTDSSIYSYGLATGFFGPMTQEAIRNFQTRFGLDSIGIIGPATTALLEGYLSMYPSEIYPANIFDKRPEVRDVSTSVTPTTASVSKVTSSSIGNPLLSVDIEMDNGEAKVEIEYKSGKEKDFIADGDDEDEIVESISDRIGVRESYIEEVATFDVKPSSKKDFDEGDAEDAIEDAEDAIEDAEDAIEDAEDDDEDVDYAEDTLDEAEDVLRDAKDAFEDEDYDEAGGLAEDAEDLARRAENRIGEEEGDDNEKGDSDEIETIEVDVNEDESEVVVEYEDGMEYTFVVEEDKIDEIIEEIADELNITESDVEDFIEFDFGRLDTIEVLVRNDKAEVKVEYRSSVIRRFKLDEDSENRLIDEIADELDEDEDDVEDVISFDYD